MKKLYTDILQIIREGGRIMTSPLHDEIEGSVKEKSGDVTNLVTKYDVAVQKHLISRLTELLPDAYFFAEEKDNDPEGIMSEHCFIIDPIDGTTNFVHGDNYSCISVALVSRGEAVFGAVYNPYLNEMFVAVRGEGATLNGAPISVSKRSMPHAVITIGTAPYYKNKIGSNCIDIITKVYNSCIDIRRFGSAALDMCYVAAGRADAFCELMLSPWDFAAAMLIVSEAGGVISNERGELPSLSAPSPMIASSPEIYGEFKAIIDSALGGKTVAELLA